jgi:hypothetical protein
VRTAPTPSVPGRIIDLAVDGDTLTFTATGDDGRCGTATAYRVFAGDEEIAVDATPKAAGSSESLTLDLPDRGRRPITVQVVDEAGNAGPPARVKPPKT